MSSRKSSPLPQGRFLLWISTIWCDRNGVKLYQYDRNESRRSVSMVGSHHPWIEPGRWSCRGVKGTAMEVFSKSFFPLQMSFFTQILTWWNMGFMEWWLEFLVQQGIEEYDLTFSRYWCLIYGLSVLYLTLICTTGKKISVLLGLGSKLHLQNSMVSLIPWKGKLLENWKIQWQSLDEAQPKPSI